MIQFLFFFSFIYLFLSVLGLHFCVRAFSSCGKRGPLFIAVHGPLAVAASLVVEHRLQTRRLSSCGSQAQLLRGMWDLPRPGLEPVSPALAGRLSTTAPPGKPCFNFIEITSSSSSKGTKSPHNWFNILKRASLRCLKSLWINFNNLLAESFKLSVEMPISQIANVSHG